VEIVRREMERIDTLVSQMLKFSRPPRSAHTPVKVHDILDLSLRLIQPQFKSKSINVNRSLNAPDDVIQGDEQQLEQAFVNLLINSMEAMGPNGRLEIETSGTPPASDRKEEDGEAAGFLTIKITDNGGGITAENLKHLFEPFFTTKKHGTGLGLAITRKIIMEHHGEVRARSRPGSGATFEIRLPLAQS
jgi:two-component system NtrC family sensor kinase